MSTVNTHQVIYIILNQTQSKFNFMIGAVNTKYWNIITCVISNIYWIYIKRENTVCQNINWYINNIVE